MLRGRSWLALAIAPALAACSLIYKSDLDDARRPSSSSPDAGPDVGTVPIGVVDAGPDVVTPIATGCAAFPTAKFCDDFDTELNVNDGWDRLGLTDEHAKGGFDALAFSVPRSFHAALAGATNDCSYARLEKGFSIGTNAKRATVSARVRPQAPWTGDAAIFNVSLTGCGIILGLGVDLPSYTSGINAQFVAGTLQNDYRDVDGFPTPDEWTDVTFDAQAQPDGHVKLDVVFDHASGARDDKQVDLPQCRLDGGTVFVGLGFHCSQDTHDARYDDVRVSWE